MNERKKIDHENIITVKKRHLATKVRRNVAETLVRRALPNLVYFTSDASAHVYLRIVRLARMQVDTNNI